ncbi:MAG: MCE family protein [Actinomycetes bacterium]
MTPFRERNPVVIGAVGVIVLAALLLAAFNIDSLPLIGRADHYAVALSEAGGLKTGDDVRRAGVKVGRVEDVTLEGDHVRVDLRVDPGTRLGDRTTAAVKIKTLLGQKLLMLEPAGSRPMAQGSEIPVSRTTSAYDVVDAFSDLATTEQRIDTGQLSQALDTVATTFQGTPDEVKGAVDGLSRLSRTIASRDQELQALLAHADAVTGVLDQRKAQLTQLLGDGDLLLQEVIKRREAIDSLLRTTSSLAQQLEGLVRDNRSQLAPSLQHLRGVLATLQRHRDDLDRSITLMAPFTRYFANTLGSGPWFDTYIQNLVPLPAVPDLPGIPKASDLLKTDRAKADQLKGQR